MINFKQYLNEEKKKFKSSDRLSDFLDHLMSVVVASHQRHKPLNEVTLLDTTKPKGKQVPVPNVLEHGAVTQRDVPEHVERYKKLRENGQRISSNVGGNVYKHMKAGFDSYMEKYKSGNFGKKDLAASKKHHHEYRQERMDYGSKPKSNFWMGKNTKIKKNEKQAENSTGLSLSPYTMHGIAGHNACVKASSECRNSCLAYTTGQNAMLSNINSKIGKHHYLAEHPEHAAAQIHHEMLSHVDNTAKENKEKGTNNTVGFRMNVTSDYHMRHLMGGMLDHVAEHAKKQGVEMKVRDYTKHAERLYQKKPSYHFMALSHTGTGHEESNDEDVSKALHHGHTVAAVVHGDATHFYDHKTKRLFPIADGDHDDMIENRHKEVGHTVHGDGTGSDPKTGQKTGVVSALRIKGISGKVKKAAGKFENQTTTIDHPEHGKMNVVEINKPKRPLTLQQVF
jgi:hypothetical protein